MTRQADQQRRDFEIQLREQGEQFETQLKRERKEMEDKLSHQIAQAIQINHQPQAITPPGPAVIQFPPEFYQMFANQDQQLSHIAAFLTHTVATPGPTESGKQPPEMVDLTMDNEDLEHKKQDVKQTPQHQRRELTMQSVVHMVDNLQSSQGASTTQTFADSTTVCNYTKQISVQ